MSPLGLHCLLQGKIYFTLYKEAWVGPRAGPGAWREKSILPLSGIETRIILIATTTELTRTLLYKMCGCWAIAISAALAPQLKVVSQVKRAEPEISVILIGGKRTTVRPLCRCNSERQYFLSKPQKLEE
jgi:hypothetical protein